MKKVLLFVLMVTVVSGCMTTSTRKLREISLGMTKDEVVKRLGEPTAVRGAIRNMHDQNIEVWEYRLSKSQAGKFWGGLSASILTFGVYTPAAYQDSQSDITNFWLYFYDDKLVQWGQAGDWKKEADRIYEINFDTSEKLTR